MDKEECFFCEVVLVVELSRIGGFSYALWLGSGKEKPRCVSWVRCICQSAVAF